MIKKLLICASIVAGLSSCTEDFKDWLSPQQNAAEKAAEAFVMTVSPAVSDIDFATYTEENVQLFSTNLEAGQTDSYTVVFTGNDKTATYTTADGSIPTAELASIVTGLYGKAPQSRVISAGVTADVKVTTGSTTVVAEKTVAPYTFTATPNAPVIYPHLYLIGAPSMWDPTCTSLPFNHSGADVYDDPVFTITVPVAAGEMWFAITDDYTVETNDWSNVFGAREGNGNNLVGTPGMITRRTDLTDDGSFKVNPTEACNMKVTVNMLEGTYLIELLPAVPEYYIVGRQNGWSLSKGSALMPVTSTSASYTSYFTGAWDCRVATPQQIADGNWNNFGSTEENGACTTLAENTGNCIMSPAEGYYTLTVDFGTMTYSWTPVTVSATYTSVGLIGGFNGWGEDLALTQVEGSADLNGNTTHNWTATNVVFAEDTELKFRANGSWDFNWGVEATVSGGYIYGTGVSNGANIAVAAGTYNVYFNDITGQFLFVKQ